MGEMIFKPWVAAMQESGCRFLSNKRVTDLVLDEASGEVSGVLCGEEEFPADAVIFAVGISAMQKIVPSRYFLTTTHTTATPFTVLRAASCPDHTTLSVLFRP